MAMFADKATYRFTVEDPDSKEEFWFKLKKLSEGDVQDRSDLVTRVKMGDDRSQRRKRRGGKKAKPQRASGDEALYMIGEVRRFDLVHSLVAWNFPEVNEDGEPTGIIAKINDDTIRQLDSSIAEEIHEEISELNPRLFGGDREEDEEDVPTDEEEEDDEVVDPTKTISEIRPGPGSEEIQNTSG